MKIMKWHERDELKWHEQEKLESDFLSAGLRVYAIGHKNGRFAGRWNGIWNLPIKFNKSESGGSCTPGCHKVKDYDRVDPVKYLLPDAKDKKA